MAERHGHPAQDNADAAFDQALMQALALVERDPPAFVPPRTIALPAALVRSMRQLTQAADITRSTLRLAFRLL